MRYRVIFDTPVVYLPNHPKGRLETTEIMVWADTSAQAMQHAIRVTEGAGQAVTVEEADG